MKPRRRSPLKADRRGNSECASSAGNLNMRAVSCRSLLALTLLIGIGGCAQESSDRDAPSDRQVAERSKARAENELVEARKDLIDAESRAATEAQGRRGLATARRRAATESAEPLGDGTDRLLSEADRASFQRLAASLPGAEGVAISALGRRRHVQRLGSLRGGAAWSTAKVPVAMAAVAAGVAGSADLERAITGSDNAAAERLWMALGGGARAAALSDAQLRAAGDERTEVQALQLRPPYSAFGQTYWTLANQARFVAGMSCVPSGAPVLELMGRIVSSQRWGIGAAESGARFKGGWGPGVMPGVEDGWLDRQMGVLVVKGKPLAVAIATNSSEHATGARHLTALARWISSNLSSERAAKVAHC